MYYFAFRKKWQKIHENVEYCIAFHFLAQFPKYREGNYSCVIKDTELVTKPLLDFIEL